MAVVNSRDYGLLEGSLSTVPDEEATHWAGMRQPREALDDTVRSVRIDDIGANECVIVYGELGAGKSHALKYFARKINNTGDYGDGPRGLAIFIGHAAAESNPKFASLYPQVLKPLKTGAEAVVSENVQRVAPASYPEADREQVIALQRGDGFLQLEDAKDDLEAANRLASIFRIMTTPVQDNQPAYGAVYLFLDEMETLHTGTTKVPTIFAYYGALRSLINGVSRHFALVTSYSLQSVVMEASLPDFFIERVTRKWVEIPPLGPEDAKEFIADYLEVRRPEGFSNENPFHPFSEAAIDAILEVETMPVPRRVLRLMHRVFDRAARRGGLQPGEEIAGDVAESILEVVV